MRWDVSGASRVRGRVLYARGGWGEAAGAVDELAEVAKPGGGVAGGRGDVGVGGFAAAGLIPEFLFGGRLDGAVGEEEGLSSGCARVQGDGVVGVGINVGASGGAGEKEPELLVGNGGEV